MKVSDYKKLLVENPRAAMIFDLTERFPRGPLGKLRKKHYTMDQWGDTPVSEELIGGKLGYDMFTLYELSTENWYESNMAMITTTIESAAMGDQIMEFDHDKRVQVPTGRYRMFKYGAQTTRRIRRLESRLRAARRRVEEKSSANLYRMSISGTDGYVAIFGDSETHVRQQFDLLLAPAFKAGIPSGAIRTGYYSNEEELRTHVHFDGPSHGAHEIMANNQEYVAGLAKQNADRAEKIKRLQEQITVTNDIMAMVDTFTINTCAQQGFNTEEKS